MIYEFEYDYCEWAIEVDERWLRELRRFIERFIGPLCIVVSLKVLWRIYYGEGLALLRLVFACLVTGFRTICNGPRQTKLGLVVTNGIRAKHRAVC